MPHPQLDRSQLRVLPLSARANKVHIVRDAIAPETPPRALSGGAAETLLECVGRVRRAREAGRPVMLVFGAHSIKNGLGPVLIRLMERGWVTLLATNGAGIIHDWEFAFLGESSEDVRKNVAHGQFGIWQETGLYLNLGLVVGAFEGLGYGEAVGKMIEREGLEIPTEAALLEIVREAADLERQNVANAEQTGLSAPLSPSAALTRAAAALDLLEVIRERQIPPGWLSIPHPFKQYSAQAAAYRLGVPFTAHPMIGHDIIYNHPANRGAAIGRAAQRDFLTYAAQVHRLEGGVYMSIGSAVMSPMIFEKSLSMSQNLELQEGRSITGHYMTIVDLAESTWDWSADGEPPMDNPAYYLRYCKTFNRMGGTMRYVSADNRDFLLGLLQALEG